jgi:hypothetical protein
MVRQRTKRTERHRGASPVHLTERDLSILEAIGKMKFLRTKDVARLYFSGKKRANTRLRQLLDAGFLQCFVSALHCDNIYALSLKGRSVLADHLGKEAALLPAPKGLGRGNLSHHFALTEFRIDLVLEVHRRTDLELAFFLPEWKLKHEYGALSIDLIPDALFGLRPAGGTEATVLALEVDLGTEHPRYVGKYKVEKYRAVMEARVPLFGQMVSKVIFVVPKLRRLGQLAKVMAEYDVGDDFYLGLGGWGMGGSSWRRVGGIRRVIRGFKEGWGVEKILNDCVVDIGRSPRATDPGYSSPRVERFSIINN